MRFDPITLARPEIVELSAYQPFRSDTSGRLRLQANENNMRGDAVSRYPGPTIDTLNQRLADLYGVDNNNLLVTRGSDDAIDAIARTFLTAYKDSVLVFTPSFISYERAALIQGASVVKIPQNADLTIDFNAANATLARDKSIKIVFLSTPQNPASVAVPRADLIAFIEANPEILIVADEAYIDFSKEVSVTNCLSDYPNLIILRTLSKAWGLAGARIGCLIASENIINLVARVQPAYFLPIASIDAALSLLSPAGIARTKEEIKILSDERDALKDALRTLPSVDRVYESETNFLLIKFKDAELALKQLEAARIIARDFSHEVPNAVRITIGRPEDNPLVLQALGGESTPSKDRIARIERTTKETSIFVSVNLDKDGPSNIETGVGFFDHMLEQVAKHSGIAVTIIAKGDTFIDAHHTVEDVMLTLGSAFKEALGDKRGIGRYGFALPMDEVRAEVLLDLSGRAVSKVEGTFDSPMLGDLPTEMIPHAFISFASTLEAALHVTFDGDNDHHKSEGAFKALAKCLKQACSVEGTALPSTKGTL